MDRALQYEGVDIIQWSAAILKLHELSSLSFSKKFETSARNFLKLPRISAGTLSKRNSDGPVFSECGLQDAWELGCTASPNNGNSAERYDS